MTMVPPPAAASSGTPYLASRNAPVRLTARTRSHSSSAVSGTVLATPMPALAHSRSSRPPSRTAARTAPATSSGLAASPAWNTARPPRAVIASATRCPPARSESSRTRAAPWAANRSAPAAPIPLAAPVISPVRPARRWSGWVTGPGPLVAAGLLEHQLGAAHPVLVAAGPQVDENPDGHDQDHDERHQAPEHRPGAGERVEVGLPHHDHARRGGDHRDHQVQQRVELRTGLGEVVPHDADVAQDVHQDQADGDRVGPGEEHD